MQYYVSVHDHLKEIPISWLLQSKEGCLEAKKVLVWFLTFVLAVCIERGLFIRSLPIKALD